MTAITLTRSILYDGINDYASAGNNSSLRPTSAFTLACWYYTSEAAGKRLIEFPRAAAAPWDSLYLATGWGSFYNGTTTYSTPSGSHNTNQWCHAAVTYDGTTLKFYYNGRLNQSIAATGSVSYVTDACTIGNWASTSPTDISNFNGKLTDPRIYGRALSLTEIQQICMGTEPDTTALLGYWSLTEASGTFANSGTATSSSLTLANGAVRDTSLPTFGIMPAGIGGEVAWWVPSLTSESGTTVTNQVGGINNGTLSTSAMWATDIDGKRSLVTTANNIFSVAHSSSFVLPDNYSLSFWVKFSNYVNNAGISNKGNNSTRVMSIVSSTNSMYVQHGTVANAYFSTSLGSPTVNVWHNIIVIQSKSGATYTLSTYVDGTLIDSQSHTSNPVSSTSSFAMGGDVGATRLPMSIDDIRVFYEAISSSKIALLSSRRGYEPSWITVANHIDNFQTGSFPSGWTYAWRPDVADNGSNFSLTGWTNFTLFDAGTQWKGTRQFSTPLLGGGFCHPGDDFSTGCVLTSYTVSTSGQYRISGGINRTTGQTGNVRVFVFQNTTVLHNVSTSANATANTYWDYIVSLTAGDKITLAIDRSANFSSDGTTISSFVIQKEVLTAARRRVSQPLIGSTF